MSRPDRSASRYRRTIQRNPFGAFDSSDYSTYSEQSGDSDGSSQALDMRSSLPANPFEQRQSSAAHDWDLRKQHGETSESLDELMQYQGLEEVKQLFLDIKSKVDVCRKQDPNKKMKILKLERFSIIFQGNPGTGKHYLTSTYCSDIS